MDFVDDVRQSFDAALFVSAVRAVVRDDGRLSSSAAQDGAVVARAQHALSDFLATLRSGTRKDKDHDSDNEDEPDVQHGAVDKDEPFKRSEAVLSAYLDLSENGRELFLLLQLSRTAATGAGTIEIVAAALDCLLEVCGHVRRTIECAATSSAVRSGRSMMKDVIKTKAVLMYDVLKLQRARLSRKVVKLLHGILTAYPILNKEFINRYDVMNKLFMHALCAVDNNPCRLPFFELLTTLMRSADVDVLKFLSRGGGRHIVAHCLGVVHKKLRAEIDYPNSEQVRRQLRIMPSRVQQAELEKLTYFLNTIYTVYLTPNTPKGTRQGQGRETGPMHFLREALFADVFILQQLVSVAVIADPPLSTVPRQVTAYNVKLRKCAATLVHRILALRIDIPLGALAGCIAKTKPSSSTSTTDFVIEIVKRHPQIAPHLLDYAVALCGGNPRLTSSWLAGTAILSECLLRCNRPSQKFAQCRMLELSILHESKLVRQIGATLLLAQLKLVERDAEAMTKPGMFVPERKDIVRYAALIQKGSDNAPKQSKGNGGGEEEEEYKNDIVLHNILMSYRRIFGVNYYVATNTTTHDGTDANGTEGSASNASNSNAKSGTTMKDIMYTSLVCSDGQFLTIEDIVRDELKFKTGETVSKIINRKYFIAMIHQAMQLTDEYDRNRLWTLIGDILKSMDLFPQKTCHNIDIFLLVLSSYRGNDLFTCVQLLQEIILIALSQPYGLFDQLYDVHKSSDQYQPNVSANTSLFTVACVHRFKKLHQKLNDPHTPSKKRAKKKAKKRSDIEKDSISYIFLKDALVAHIAFDEVINGHTPSADQPSFLDRHLPNLLSSDESESVQCLFSTREHSSLHRTVTRKEAIDFALSIFNRPTLQYPLVPYLKAVLYSCHFRKSLLTGSIASVNTTANHPYSQSDMAPTLVHLGTMWSALSEWKDSQSRSQLYSRDADAGIVLYNGTAKKTSVVEWNDPVGILLNIQDVYLESGNAKVDDYLAPFLAKLRRKLEPADFSVILCVLLRTSQNSDVWKIVLRTLLSEMNKDRAEAGSTTNDDLDSFQRLSVLSAIRRSAFVQADIVQFVVSFVLNLLTVEGAMRVGTEQTRLSFSFDLLHTILFHKQLDVCTYARLILPNSQCEVHSDWDVKTLPPRSAKVLTEIIPYFPGLRVNLKHQLGQWNMAWDGVVLSPSMLSLVVQLFTSLELDATDDVDEGGKGNDSLQREPFCKELLFKSTLTLPPQGTIKGVPQGCTIGDEQNLRSAIVQLANWSRIQEDEFIAAITDSIRMATESTSDADDRVVMILLFCEIILADQHPSSSSELFTYLTKTSRRNQRTILNTLSVFFQATTLQPYHLQHKITLTLLHTYLTQIATWYVDDDTECAQTKTAPLRLYPSIESLWYALTETVEVWITADQERKAKHQTHYDQRLDSFEAEQEHTTSPEFEEIVQCFAAFSEIRALNHTHIVKMLMVLSLRNWVYLKNRVASLKKDVCGEDSRGDRGNERADKGDKHRKADIEARKRKRRHDQAEGESGETSSFACKEEHVAKYEFERFAVHMYDFVRGVLRRLHEQVATDKQAAEHEEEENDRQWHVVCNALFGARELLNESVTYEAQVCEHDLKLKWTLRGIDTFLRLAHVEHYRSVRILAGDGGLWNGAAIAMLNSFSRPALESARDNVHRWRADDGDTEFAHFAHVGNGVRSAPAVDSSILWPSRRTSHHADLASIADRGRRSPGTDPEFVLRTLLASCLQALETPQAPLLDLGKVVHEGSLAVALTALCGANQRCRMLGYACVDRLAAVVGPVHDVTRTHASVLYRERKQLAFLLAQLRHSVTVTYATAFPRVPPLFAAWFAAAARVALTPAHDANKPAVAMLLRDAVYDMARDDRVAQLFNCATPDAHAARYLALDALRHAPAARRPLLDHVLLLCAARNGVDDNMKQQYHHASVRQHAFNVLLRTVSERGPDERSSSRWLRDVAWACGQRGTGDNVHSTRSKLAILTAAAGDDGCDAANANSLQDALAKQGMQRGTQRAALRCALAIVRAVGFHRVRLFGTDFAQWCGTGTVDIDAVRVIIRQREERLSDDALLQLVAARTRIEHPVDLVVLDCFVARCLTARIATTPANNAPTTPDPRLVHAMAATITHPARSVWTLVAALAVQAMRAGTTPRSEDAEWLAVAEEVPAQIPDHEVCLSTVHRFRDVVRRGAPVVASALLQPCERSRV